MRATAVVIFTALVCVVSIFGDKNRKIIIVGSGAAGIAAASRLIDNGFTNVTILEAQDRIGGRVFTTKIGDYLVDMGGQWVHGDVDNIVFNMSNPLGLVQNSKDYGEVNFQKMYGSSGSDIPEDIARKIFNFYNQASNNIKFNESKTGSLGEFFVNRFEEFLKTIPEISPEQHQPLIDLFNRFQMASDGAYDWHEVSAKSIADYEGMRGDERVNWKERGYSTILDILMKKIPDPAEELPVMNNTILNAKVTKINYENNESVKVSTADGKEYEADSVIVTCSLGVLKSDFENLFSPPLPENKINAIKNLGYGEVAKIYLLYDDPWWQPEDNFVKSLLWSKEDKAELESDPERSWMLGVSCGISIEHKLKLLCLWMTGKYAKQMEKIPDELFNNQTLGLINRFFSRDYNITQPKEIVRTNWNTNENFRGTYSYHSVNSNNFNAINEDLAEPIVRNNKPIIQFAGEATEPREYSTVHGAVTSGFREADRLIKLNADDSEKTK